MAIKLENLAGGVVAFLRTLGNTSAAGAGEGVLGSHLENLNGLPLAKLDGQAQDNAQYGLPLMVQSDNNLLLARGDRSGGLAIATIQPLFSWFVEGTVLNSRLLNPFSSTQTALQTAQGLTLNAGALNTANTSYQLNTALLVPLHMKALVLMRLRARVTQIGVANTSCDFGYLTVNTTLNQAANLNGAYWRIDGTGAVPVLAINGAVVLTGAAVAVGATPTSLNNTDYFHWGILRDDDSWTFTIQNSATGVVFYRQKLQVPSGQQKAFLASHAQPYIRTFNGAVTPTVGAQMVVSEWTIGMLDTNMNMSQAQICTGLGLGSESGPLSYATTSNLLNATVAPTTTPTNTAATVAALDGAVRIAGPGGSANDVALFSYAVPAPYRYRTKRVIVAAKNLGAAVAVTPTQIDYYLAYNGNGATLAGNLLRKYVGTQTFAVGAAIGSAAAEGRLELNLSEADAITEAGRFVTLVARISTGTATVGQLIETNYANLGHFE